MHKNMIYNLYWILQFSETIASGELHVTNRNIAESSATAQNCTEQMEPIDVDGDDPQQQQTPSPPPQPATAPPQQPATAPPQQLATAPPQQPPTVPPPQPQTPQPQRATPVHTQPEHHLKQQQLGARYLKPAKTDQERFERHVAYFIAMTCSPYAIVENVGFKKLMKFALPNYHLPCRTTFSNSRIPALYARTKQTIRDRLKAADFVALSTDGWTALNRSQFICVTCAFVDTDWVLRTVTLACRELNTSHTALNISECIKNIIAEYDIDLAKVTAITTDRAANMIAAVKLLRMNHVACFAHALNTIVHKMLDNKYIKPALDKAKKTYNIMAHSPLATRLLAECQRTSSLPEKKMPSSCVTRWWSEMAQMKFMMDNQVALFSFLTTYADGVHAEYQLDVIATARMKIVYSLLEKFEVIATALGSEQESTSSLILPMLKMVRVILTNKEPENEHDRRRTSDLAIILFRKDLLVLANELDAIYETESSHLEVANYLDPRVLSTSISSAEPVIRLDVADNESSVLPSAAQIPRCSDGSAVSKLQKMLEKMNGVQSSSEVPVESLSTEMMQFRSQPPLGLEADPLSWWAGRQGLFPQLAAVAKKYLCVPATSVASERVFSASSMVLTKFRSSLTDEHVDELVFLMKNKDYVLV